MCTGNLICEIRKLFQGNKLHDTQCAKHNIVFIRKFMDLNIQSCFKKYQTINQVQIKSSGLLHSVN